VKKLIELQDGKISIESDLNQGTEVSFYIPYKTGNPKKTKELKQPGLVIPDRVKGLRILGVDDEEFNRYLLKVIFEKWGCYYREAHDGNEAVKMALEHDFDMILMDVRMPELNGIEATKLIVKEKPHSNIIAVAAVDGKSDMELCKQAGMGHFLSKPFSEADLLNMIIDVCKIDREDDVLDEEFDLKEFERMANGDLGFLKEMVDIFIRSTQNGIENINLAFEEENWQGISDAAHKMAAPCKHIMANDLYDKIKQLEKNTNNLEDLQQVPELVASIADKVDKINSSLSVLIESGRFDT
jgi:CheY-like chemotaxis protein